jgi:protein tyrosine/serine phosphatase
VVALLALAAQQAWRHGTRYVVPIRFATVEPGRIYRGAWQEDRPMRRIVRDYKIKTIVALAHPPEHDLPIKEGALARELGVRWVHLPILDDPKLAQGKDLNDLLDEAAALVADPANQPVYFHCHHGVVRTSMVQVAYRTRYCGWDLDRAYAEVVRQFGAVEIAPADRDRLASYYRQRVLPAGSGLAKGAAGTARR